LINKDLPKVLYALANRTDAKTNGYGIILRAAAAELETWREKYRSSAATVAQEAIERQKGKYK
jgi:hypothetical protein